MQRAEYQLKMQIEDSPPYNAPWSFFDLSTIYLIKGKTQEAMDVLTNGVPFATANWMLGTHLDTLMLVEDRQQELPGWREICDLLKTLVVPGA
jgi:hypothetical protein